MLENFTFNFGALKILNFRPFLVLIYKYDLGVFTPPCLTKFCNLRLKMLNFRPCFSLNG